MAKLRASAMWVAALLVAAVAVTPQANYLLSLQFPPVARVGEHYNFQFAYTTFQPSPDRLQYSLVGNPPWLSLDGKNRMLWGTPGAGDIGTATFKIVAAGEAGAVAYMETKLFVADGKAPTTNENIFQQLSSDGRLSGLKTFTLLPSKPFDIRFPPETFQSSKKELTYHATLADRTPLPAWICFDEPSLHFSGTTPSLTSEPQSYDILLLASDIPGYSTASLSFTLTISNHQLIFKPLQQIINLYKGETVNISNIRSKVFLDNRPIKDEEILSASAELPSWLSFNEQTLEVTGTPPPGLMSQNISITAKDTFSDMAKLPVHLVFESQFFNEEIGRLNITAGEYFEYRIPKSVLTKENAKISVDLGALGKWLTFNLETCIISGTVPNDSAPQDVQASLTATSPDDNSTDSQIFHLQISDAGDHIYPSSTTSVIAAWQPGETGKNTDETELSRTPKSKKTAVIVGSVFGAIGALLVIAMLACLFYRQRKKPQGYISPRGPRSPRKVDISRPILMKEECSNVDRTLDPDMEKGESDNTLDSTPDHPPQLKLDFALKESNSHSTASSITEGEAKILTACDNSSWGYKDEAGPSHHPPNPMKVPTEMARRKSTKSYIPNQTRHRTISVYRNPYFSSGLPLNWRLTGLGQGCHAYSPPRSNKNFSAFRRSSSCSTFSTQSTGILSRTPVFPQPSAARHTTQLTTPMEKCRSIRLLSSTCDSLVDRRIIDEKRKSYIRKRSSVQDSLTDRRTIDEKRQSYIRKRASAQSPFFGANSSRNSCSSYKLPAVANDSTIASKPALFPLGANHTMQENEVAKTLVGRDLPENLRVRKPLVPPLAEAPQVIPGSLRRPVAERPFARYTNTGMDHEGDQTRYDWLGKAGSTRPVTSRRSDSYESSRGTQLKAILNSLTGEKIFQDAELSESVYPAEEDDIKEYEKNRETLKSNQSGLHPLSLQKRRSRRDSKYGSRRTNKRHPTPLSLTLEHGGKENRSSIYNLENVSNFPKVRNEVQVNDPSNSPERPKKTTTQCQSCPANHTRSESRTMAQASTQQRSQIQTLSRQNSHKSHYSRSQSRQSTTKHGRDRFRTQSSAYPYFESGAFSTTTPSTSKQQPTSKGQSSAPRKDTAPSLISRDLSGNILNYADNEDLLIEQMPSSPIGICTWNSQIQSSARQSRLAQFSSRQHVASSSKRETTLPSTPTNTSAGLSLVRGSLDRVGETPATDGRERTPLSVSDNGNGGSPERVRYVEGKGKKPVNVVNGEDGRGSGRERRTWGSLKGIMARGRYESFEWGSGTAFL
ncbi:hypothetical protein CC78DRAFT_120038 [Lojkania enalia]|uniref:Dystroglycan-type cadherin-like domain-containing protein n=1 Tax=Lojkania enalia TaxID=147567 RepID=A0A9P4KDI9_9PLEO|nr:hypothetical protein CC78DRAFT_120038 [Didymosphaeria enalia]